MPMSMRQVESSWLKVQDFDPGDRGILLSETICLLLGTNTSISGLVVEYIIAINVTWVRFPADALIRALRSTN